MAYTLTFGDQAENHVGMQKLGKLAEHGFSIDDLEWMNQQMGNLGTIYNLNLLLPEGVEADPAYLLVIPNGVNILANADQMFEEQQGLDYDKKKFMYGGVKNSVARHNICFGYQDQEPDYENKKGRIVSFESLPALNSFRQALADKFGTLVDDLYVEGNHYYDPSKCGIGFHGDAERRKVIGVRLGQSVPLHYQWHHRSKPIGDRGGLMLGHGDMYVMSEKAVGKDWKSHSLITLRHAAGADEFLWKK